MKKFKFKLESVLTLRKQKEEEIQLKMAAFQKRIDEALRGFENLKVQKDQIANQLEQFKTNPGGIDNLLLYQQYLESLELEIENRQAQIDLMREELEEIRGELMHAAQQRKIIEKMKEKQRKQYDREVLTNEINFLDDIGTIRSVRSKIE